MLTPTVAQQKPQRQQMPPAVLDAVKTWQRCVATSYKAQKQTIADKEAAADQSFATCQPEFDAIISVATQSGLNPTGVRQGLLKGKASLRKQMIATF